MTLGVRPVRVGIIESIPSLPIHSSVLIAAVAGLFLAALILRAQRLPDQPVERHPGLTARQARLARKRALRRMQRRAERKERRAHMSMTARDQANAKATATSDGPATPNIAAPRRQAAATDSGTGFRIYWGRTLLAAAALLGLLGGIVTGVLSLVSVVSWWVPAACAGVLVLSVVSLQVSAAVRRRRKRRRRVEAAMAAAMYPLEDAATGAASQPQAGETSAVNSQDSTHASRDASGPFNVLGADAAGRGGPDSLVTLDEDGLPENPERLFAAVTGTEQPTQAAKAALFDRTDSGESWEPREVPQPKYLAAEKAERAEAEPLSTPEAPKPSQDVKLRQPAAPASSSADVPAATDRSLDLDAVLKRRRA
ncbi:hypothetical protein [Nesterenkonia flava]|uniref:Transmembrane protein n=1 Tax=Nesterenkonia flava TaxID=469799 RepID=A0ABU1FRM6_9MICC|nr:hypothetical protein [Nesterenkonia flava]MDR5711299.1 hypothetical protein [Nesterenkonia flava]